jgi:hypothetical protein
MRITFLQLPVVTLADSLYHRLQIRYPSGVKTALRKLSLNPTPAFMQLRPKHGLKMVVRAT